MMNIALGIQACLGSKVEAASAILCRKRYMTLFELLLVIAILSLVSGVIVVNVNKALINQRFQTEVSQVVSTIQLAQDLMLVVNSDVHLKFAKEGEGISYWLTLETELPKGIQNEIMRKKSLKTIHGVFFKDALEYKPVYGQIDLKFLSRGAVMSNGMMRLSTSEEEENPPPNALNSYICLPGYPYPIANADDKAVAEKKCLDANDDSYDERIMRDTFSRLPEKLKQPEEASEERPEVEPKKKDTPPPSPKPTPAVQKNKTTAAADVD